jgi:hypothetical protein
MCPNVPKNAFLKNLFSRTTKDKEELITVLRG